MDHLVRLAGERRLVVYLGHGLPAGIPTSVPSMWLLDEAILDAVARRVSGLLDDDRAEELASLVLNHQLAGRLPAEVPVASAVVREPSFVPVLEVLDRAKPTAIHHVLASLIKARRVRTVITPNADSCLEQACEAIGAPLRVMDEPDHYKDWARKLDDPNESKRIANLELLNKDTPMLMKINGSARDPGGQAASLSLMDRGLPPATADCVRRQLATGHLLVVGATGAEFEGQPNYLFLRSDADEAVGLTWLLPAGTPPLPEVTALGELFGGRGHVATGESVEVLRSLLDGAEDSSASASLPDLDQLRAEAARTVHEAVDEWAATASLTGCALVMADMLIASSHEAAARPLLELARQAAQQADADHRQNAAYGQVCALLARLAAGTDERKLAVDLYQEALRIDEHLRDDSRRGEILMDVAGIAMSRGDDHDASVLLKEALSIYEHLHDDFGRAGALHQLGVVAKSRSDLDKAMKRFQKALQLRERVRDVRGIGETLIHIAGVHRSRNEDDDALRKYTEGLRIMDRLGAVKESAMARYYTGLLLRRDPDRADEALAHLRAAHDLFRQTNSRSLDRATKQITILINDYASRAGALVDAAEDGDTTPLEDALAMYQKAWEASEQIGELDTAAKIRSNMGMIEYSRLRRLDQALVHFRKAWQLFRDLGSEMADRIRKYITHCEKKLDARQSHRGPATPGA